MSQVILRSLVVLNVWISWYYIISQLQEKRAFSPHLHFCQKFPPPTRKKTWIPAPHQKSKKVVFISEEDFEVLPKLLMTLLCFRFVFFVVESLNKYRDAKCNSKDMKVMNAHCIMFENYYKKSHCRWNKMFEFSRQKLHFIRST